MSSVLVGLIAIVIGLLFCFRGVVAMRIVIALWGAFVGFMLGAGITASATGEGFLDTPLGWIVAIVAGLVLAALAYLFYVFAVVLAMASIGYAIGVTVMVAVGVEWSWAVIAVGVLVGILLAVATVALNLPDILLVIFSALGGSTAVVGGIMLLTSTISVDDFSADTITASLGDDWWWYVIYGVLVVAGVVVQARLLSAAEQPRQRW